uniref:Uncharacterized protein n=1 Tax=Octopus bimaculoides TaxID=37653 RepID=A0A0L8G1B9_OCTBM
MEATVTIVKPATPYNDNKCSKCCVKRANIKILLLKTLQFSSRTINNCNNSVNNKITTQNIAKKISIN